MNTPGPERPLLSTIYGACASRINHRTLIACGLPLPAPRGPAETAQRGTRRRFGYTHPRQTQFYATGGGFAVERA